jgi:hypothetical protein
METMEQYGSVVAIVELKKPSQLIHLKTDNPKAAGALRPTAPTSFILAMGNPPRTELLNTQAGPI